MKILIDAMGGDHAPLEIIKGAEMASKEFDAQILLVGKKSTIEQLAKENNIDLSKIEIYNANDVVRMDDAPLSVKSKTDSSMRVGLKLLNDGEVDAFVSAGNTGALHTGASLFVHRIKGIQRSAIATVIPLEKPMLLIDSGANSVVTPEQLVQFAKMGSIYMKNIFKIENPKVGLLNIGTEETKGTAVYVETFKKLRELEDINFVGNVEGKEVPFGKCDVLVADGFTGNILLKLIEGMGSFMMKKLKGLFLKNLVTQMGAIIYKDQLYKLKKDFDASEYGGAPLIGIAKPVIKAHGSSDARAIRSAVRQAISYAQTGLIDEIARCADSIAQPRDTTKEQTQE